MQSCQISNAILVEIEKDPKIHMVLQSTCQSYLNKTGEKINFFASLTHLI
jgi:hypothetical protein